MQLNGVASSILVGWLVILSLVVLSILGGIALVFWKLKTKIEQIGPKIEPLLDKVDQVLTTTNEKIGAIGDRTEHIVAQGEEVALNVHNKVNKTAFTLQRTIHAPIIALNSVATGLLRGFETFVNLSRSKLSGRNL